MSASGTVTQERTIKVAQRGGRVEPSAKLIAFAAALKINVPCPLLSPLPPRYRAAYVCCWRRSRHDDAEPQGLLLTRNRRLTLDQPSGFLILRRVCPPVPKSKKIIDLALSPAMILGR